MLQKTAIISLCLLLAASVPAQQLKIIHFDVGQGTATLIWSPSGQTMLVDAGPSLEPDGIRLYLQSQGITDLNYTLATHYHSDHIGEFPDLFQNGYLPDTAWDRGNNPGYSSSYYTNYVNTAGSARRTIIPGQIVNLGPEVQVKAICVNGHLMNGATYTLSDENERSVCLLIEYRNFRYVTSGDMSGGGLSTVDMETPCAGLIGNVNALELNHHGSNSASNNNWLNALTPEASFVSLDHDNPYGYVHTEVIGRVNACASLQKLYHTEEGFNLSPKSVVVNNHIILQTDGLTRYTIQNDTFDLGPDVYLQVWVDQQTILPIPATGGMLFWNLYAQNQQGSVVPAHVKFWLQPPVGGPVTLIDLPNYVLPILPNGAIRQRNNYIFAAAPAGMYQLVGEFRHPTTNILYATDRDTFYKAGDLDAIPASGWFIDADNSFLDEPQQVSSPEIVVYPNPFNAVTAISYELRATSFVSLEVYNTAGRLITSLVNGWQEAGRHEAAFEGSNLASGIYFYALQIEGQTASGKMLFMK